MAVFLYFYLPETNLKRRLKWNTKQSCDNSKEWATF